MPRPANDGRGRLGGRAKGTPNKPLTPVTAWINSQLNRNRGFIEQQLKTPGTETGIKLLSALIVAAAVNDTATAILTPEVINGD